jgi:hypothetical protein
MFKKVECYETNDLSIFKLFSFNRQIKRQNVNNLVNSMRVHGFKGVIQVIKTKFVDGKEGYYIADGQHRLAAAKQLGLTIRFEITEIKTKQEAIKFIATLNSSSENWSASNFLDSWSDAGIVEYVKLKEVLNETKFQLTPILQAFLFTGEQKEYRNGTMKFTNESFSRLLIKQLIEGNQYLPSKAFCRRTVIKVMCNQKYDHKKMLKAMKEYNKLVGGFSENEKQLRSELEKLMEQNC